MKYKGYTGIAEFDEDSGVIFGHIIGLRDTITFQGESVTEVTQAFHDSVDDYLEFCESRGESPEKPFSGQFVLRIAPATHRALSNAAESRGMSLNAMVESVLERELGSHSPIPLRRHAQKSLSRSPATGTRRTAAKRAFRQRLRPRLASRLRSDRPKSTRYRPNGLTGPTVYRSIQRHWFVHEMCHLWQQHRGKPGRGGYHNIEWVEVMLEVGLIPQPLTSRWDRTGDKVRHTIEPDGRFELAAKTFLERNSLGLYVDRAGEDKKKVRTRKAASKTKYVCPKCVPPLTSRANPTST